MKLVKHILNEYQIDAFGVGADELGMSRKDQEVILEYPAYPWVMEMVVKLCIENGENWLKGFTESWTSAEDEEWD